MSDITRYFLIFTMSFLALGMLICLIRAFIGPRFTDRLVGINMTNTMGIGFVCILSVYFDLPAVLDIALVYAMLSFLTITILARVVILHHKGRLLHINDNANEEGNKE